jgi:hypothetical protein
MAVEPAFFRIRLKFMVDDPEAVRERLWQEFSSGEPLVARPTGVSAEHDSVTVEFDRLPCDVRAAPTTIEQGAPGAEVLAALQGMEREPDPIVPVLRALLATTTARVRAGLPARGKTEVTVEPASPFAQEVISSSWV